MVTFVGTLCVLSVALALPLAFFRPQLVFYLFLTSKVFDNILYGYVSQAGNMGMPRAWAPADFLWLITLVAACFVRPESHAENNTLRKCLIMIFALVLVSYLQGLLLEIATSVPYMALTYSRVVHFIAALAFGLRYLTNYRRVNHFLTFCVFMIFLMFVIHIAIRFEYYMPPTAEKIGGDSQLYGGRGVLSLAPVLYLLLIAIGVGRVVSKNGLPLFSLIILLVGFAGVALSETRSTWGAAAVLALSAVLFLRKRLKLAVTFGLIAFLGLAMATALQYDVFGRFGERSGETTIALKESFFAKYGRGAEYGLVAEGYKKEPYFLLSGRGVGALHFSHRGTREAIGYWHSEYLAWLDRNGLLGLFVFLLTMYFGFSMSLRISRNSSGLMQFYGVTSFLLIMALLAEGVFHPVLSHTRAASIFVCFLVITANWAEIHYSSEAEQPVLEYEQDYIMPFEDAGQAYNDNTVS